MTRILKLSFFLFLYLSANYVAKADEKTTPMPVGTIRGRIVDATKQTLPGASVYIEKLAAILGSCHIILYICKI